MAEHSINIGPCILLNDTSILAKKSRCVYRIIKKVIDIKLHPNITREDVFFLSRTWKSRIHTLQEWQKILSKHKTPPDPTFLSGPFKGPLLLFPF
jgi:hypothetical protein